MDPNFNTSPSYGFRDRWQMFLDSMMDSECAAPDIRTYALEEDVPIIRVETEYFLKFILALKQPENILEIGTAIGYSAIAMCKYTDANTRITTIENYEKRFDIAEENFRKYGVRDRITFYKEDAIPLLGRLSTGYDMIFLDAAKGQYITMWPDLKRLLKGGGLLVCDNILQDGETMESSFFVERRDRTIHKRMREFIKTVLSDKQFTGDMMTLGDGILTAVKSKTAELS